MGWQGTVKLVHGIPFSDRGEWRSEKGIKPVTIAAGFRAQGGVLLCADTLITQGTVNTWEQKIVPFNIPNLNANAAIAFAGTLGDCKTAVRRIHRAFIAAPTSRKPVTSEFILETLERVLLKFHREQIYCNPKYKDWDGPIVELIVAVQDCGAHRVFLFSSSEVNVIPVSGYAFVGCGKPIAEYIAAPLNYFPDRGNKHVLTLASHVLNQVKNFVPGCGGASQFFFLGNDGAFNPVHTESFKDERYSNTFRQIVADLFYAAADLDLDDQLVDLGIRELRNRIKEIRTEQREMRELTLATAKVIALPAWPEKKE